MVDSSSQVIKDGLHDWIMEQTRALDVVASWESLCDTYRALEFIDPISDTVRLEEYKWIIKEMNKHLTRARKKLLTCQDHNAVIQCLADMFSPTGETKINGRRDLAYQKLKQRWVLQMIAETKELETQMLEMEGAANGWTS